VEGMWRIVQQPEADDYVLATGEAHGVRELVERLFAWLQGFRRLVTRFEFHAENFLGMVRLACMKILLRFVCCVFIGPVLVFSLQSVLRTY
jgi:hypothetical protein